MSLTREESALMAKRDELSRAAQVMIGDLTDDVLRTFRAHGFNALNDDRLAAVEAALVRYFLASNQ